MPDSRPIEALGPQHDRAAFSCGESNLDTYLQRQASQDVRRRVAQVLVPIGDGPKAIAGYCSLSAASFSRAELPAAQAKKLPHYPVPAAILGRLAVDRRYHGQGLGETLLIDAAERVLRASGSVAICAIIVDALNDAVAGFYLRYSFRRFSSDPHRLVLPLDTFLKAGL